MAIAPPVLAEIVNVKPNVTDDIGNWETTTVDELQIRLNGFSGYFTDGVFADLGVKTTHPQHIARLPNAIGPDGQWHAYFAISHSDDWGFCPTNPGGIFPDLKCGGDGFWMVAQIDEEDYDEAADLIITNNGRPGDSPMRQGTEGQYVYEERFTTDVPLVSPNCSPTPCLKNGKIWYSGAGDWNHPAAMATIGDALLMVGQQFDGTGTITMGHDADALLFYDVSQPWAPAYVGKLDVCQLGLATECGGLLLSGRNVLSGLGLAYFENGWYHLSVAGGAGVVGNFYCDSGVDCFKAPVTVGPSGKWKDLPPSGVEQQAGSQQGHMIHSREIYSPAPAPGEPCYTPDGTLLTEEHAMCSPPGMQRAIFLRAADGDNLFVQGRCWPYVTCGIDIYNSPSLSTYRNDAGVPIFETLNYAKTDGSGSVLSPDPDALIFDGKVYAQGRGGPGTAEFVTTQLTSECKPNNGAHVDDNGNVIIYCVSESVDEPINGYNRIFSNRANGTLRYGVIRFIEPGGREIVYRGRGWTDVEQLNNPPWGPGRNPDGTLKVPNAVDWKVALSTPGTIIQVLSGKWAYYSDENFGGPNAYVVSPSFSTDAWVIGNPGTPRMRSLRALPEHGIALFDDTLQRGRMISAVRSVPNLVRYCGEYNICSNLNPLGPDSDNTCDVLENSLFTKVKCTWPRTFWGKASSSYVRRSSWRIYGDENYNPAYAGTEWEGTRFGHWADGFSEGRSILNLPRGNCIAPPKPVGPFATSFPFGDSRPLLRWQRLPGGGPVANANFYNIVVERQDGAIIFNERRPDPAPFFVGTGVGSYPDPTVGYMPAESKLNVGETYRWRVRGIDAQNDCYEEGPWSDYQSITIEAPAVEVSISGVTSDPLGLGTGSIDFAPGSALPSSDLGGNFFSDGAIIILVATAAPGSEFVGWAGDAAVCGTATQCPLTVTANLNVQAVFRPKPRLLRAPNVTAWGTITVNPTGVDCSNGSWLHCDAYATGTQVTMTAAAVPGESLFIRWAGDADCTDDDDNDGNPLTNRVTLSETRACTAIFGRSNYLLEVTTATSGGSVSGIDDIPGAITCDPQGQVCSKTYAAGIEQIATLTATPDTGFRFVRWNGSDECWSAANGEGTNNPINVTVGSDDVFCRAVFVDENGVFTLNVQKIGAGAGASIITGVVTAPTPAELPDVDCPLPACTTEVASTATVQLTATPVRGARFDGWFGSDPLCESPDPNPVITIDMADVAALGGDLNCRANFSAKVLLVDGSDGDSLRSQYVSEFNKIPNVDFDEWSVRSPNSTGNPSGRAEPIAADLAAYSRVIWYTGAASQAGALPLAAGPSPTAESALGGFLDGGGCLLLSSAEYVGDRGLTSFAVNYFGASTINQDVDDPDINVRTEIGGAGLLPGFSRFGRGRLDHPEGSGTDLVAKKNDAIVPNTEPGTNVLFNYSAGASGAAAVGRDNGVYRTAFLGFPIMALPFEDPTETVSEFDGRNDIIGPFLDYCLQIEKDDDFESNDDGVSDALRSDIDDQRATRLQGNVELTDLKILPGNEDWFRWETSVQADTRFEILFSDNSGDLNFDFYEGNRRDPIDSIQSTDDNEFRDFFTFPGQAFYLRVYGVNGASNSYTLKIRSTFVDTDNDGISNYLDTDDDGDGMSDEFETSNGFDPLLADDAFLDADGDGFTNFEEFIAGTDPRDSASVPTPPAVFAREGFFNLPEPCDPALPSHLCAPIGLPWLGILLGDEE